MHKEQEKEQSKDCQSLGLGIHLAEGTLGPAQTRADARGLQASFQVGASRLRSIELKVADVPPYTHTQIYRAINIWNPEAGLGMRSPYLGRGARTGEVELGEKGATFGRGTFLSSPVFTGRA